jgi:hypothetical protein
MTENQNPQQNPIPEDLPVDDTIHVIAYREIYKTAKWWCFVILGNMYGHDKIRTYLWQWDETKGKWKRKHVFGINFEKDWVKIKAAVDEFLPRISGVTV